MKKLLRKQLGISLNMLRESISGMDQSVWTEEGHSNPAWQIAYHAIFFANLYSAPSHEKLVPWPHEIKNYETLKGDEHCSEAEITKIFTQEEMLAYLDHVIAQLDDYVDGFNPEADCWPFWYKQNQLEFAMNNLRHIQHHTGQLIERQSGKKAISIRWR